MTKSIFPSLAVLILLYTLAACSGNDDQKTGSTAEPSIEKSAPRQLAFRPGIDSSNSYSKLFIDSSRVETFIEKEKIGGDTANDIRSFYNNRAFQFAWFTDSGFTEQALAFRSLYDYDKDSAAGRRQLDNQLDKLINTDSLVPNVHDPHISSTELMMSWRLANYLGKKFPDNDKKYALLADLVPYKKQPAAEWISAISSKPVQIASSNQWYSQLAKSLDRLSVLMSLSSWLSSCRRPAALSLS